MNWLIKLFGLDHITEENDKLARDNISLAMQVGNLKAQYEDLSDKYQELSRMAVDPIGYVNEHTRKIDEQFGEVMKVCEEIVKEANDRIDMCDRMEHRAFARGRQSAYSEMGIANIEAHEKGGNTGVLQDGTEVVWYRLDEFADVKPCGVLVDVKEDEIEIDDLVGHNDFWITVEDRGAR